MIEIHNRSAMHALERASGELPLELLQGVLREYGPRRGVDGHKRPVERRMGNVTRVYERRTVMRRDGKLRRLRGARGIERSHRTVIERQTRASKSPRKPHVIDRFQKVIDRSDIERLHRVLGVRGQENDVSARLGFDVRNVRPAPTIPGSPTPMPSTSDAETAA